MLITKKKEAQDRTMRYIFSALEICRKTVQEMS